MTVGCRKDPEGTRGTVSDICSPWLLGPPSRPISCLGEELAFLSFADPSALPLGGHSCSLSVILASGGKVAVPTSHFQRQRTLDLLVDISRKPQQTCVREAAMGSRVLSQPCSLSAGTEPSPVFGGDCGEIPGPLEMGTRDPGNPGTCTQDSLWLARPLG